jgi:hypothetical protein
MDNKVNLNESVRAGGFFRQVALSGKPEDDTYVDSEGRKIPDDEVEKFKTADKEKSDKVEAASKNIPGTHGAVVEQQAVVDVTGTRSDVSGTETGVAERARVAREAAAARGGETF